MPSPSIDFTPQASLPGSLLTASASPSNATASEPFSQTLQQSLQAQQASVPEAPAAPPSPAPTASTNTGNSPAQPPASADTTGNSASQGASSTNQSTAATQSDQRAATDSAKHGKDDHASQQKHGEGKHVTAEQGAIPATTGTDAGAAAAAAVQAQLQLRAGNTSQTSASTSADDDAPGTSLTALSANSATDDDPLADAQTPDAAPSSAALHALSTHLPMGTHGLPRDAGNGSADNTGANGSSDAQTANGVRGRDAHGFGAQLANASGDASNGAGTATTGGSAAPAQIDLTASVNTTSAANPANPDLAATALSGALPVGAAASAAGGSSANSATLSPTVGSTDWEDALGQKVMFLANAGHSSAELTLNPPGLGPLQISLHIADDNAHALFVAQHAQVRDAVEAALPKLRSAFEASGLNLGSASVSDQGFSSARQNSQSGQGNSSRQQTSPQNKTADTEVSAVGGSVGQSTVLRAGLVNTFA